MADTEVGLHDMSATVGKERTKKSKNKKTPSAVEEPNTDHPESATVEAVAVPSAEADPTASSTSARTKKPKQKKTVEHVATPSATPDDDQNQEIEESKDDKPKINKKALAQPTPEPEPEPAPHSDEAQVAIDSNSPPVESAITFTLLNLIISFPEKFYSLLSRCIGTENWTYINSIIGLAFITLLMIPGNIAVNIFLSYRLDPTGLFIKTGYEYSQHYTGGILAVRKTLQFQTCLRILACEALWTRHFLNILTTCFVSSTLLFIWRHVCRLGGFINCLPWVGQRPP